MGRRGQQPVLITGAATSPAEEFAARRRRYLLIMSMRIPSLVLAGVLAVAFGWTTAAAVLALLVVPLPWIAVLLANGGPPRERAKVALYRSERVLQPPETRALGHPQIIEAPVDGAA